MLSRPHWSGPWIAAIASLLVSLLSGIPGASAQTAAKPNPTSRLDAYGNVHSAYPSRRSLNVYQNQTQRRLLGVYQDQGRRLERRGGYSPFALPADVLGLTQFQPGRSIRSPYQPAGPSATQRRIFNRYGGFESELNRDEALRIDTILDRRHELILATSLNAPVHRVYLQAPATLGLPPQLATTPFVRDEQQTPAESDVSLGDRLGTQIGLARARVREEGWGWFEDGAYRRAARSFETAALLEPDDSVSRIAALFCQVSLGATQTAVALLREINVRDRNPFGHDLDIAEAFGDTTEVRRVRASVQLQASIAFGQADLRALYALVLWYLGERTEAVTSADSLARDHPGSPYTHWPAAMRNALAGTGNRRVRPMP
jgi:hypothetical protein